MLQRGESFRIVYNPQGWTPLIKALKSRTTRAIGIEPSDGCQRYVSMAPPSEDASTICDSGPGYGASKAR